MDKKSHVKIGDQQSAEIRQTDLDDDVPTGKSGKLDLAKLKAKGSMITRTADQVKHLNRLVVPNILTSKTGDAPRNSFPSNKIKTASYTPLTFIPLALMVQYTRVAVVFWTFNCFLMGFPAITTNNPLTVFTLVALVIVLGMVKEYIADSKRTAEDNRVNFAKFTQVIDVKEGKGDGSTKMYEFTTTPVNCQDIKVGDILELSENQWVPADVIILKTLDKDSGEASISTG